MNEQIKKTRAEKISDSMKKKWAEKKAKERADASTVPEGFEEFTAGRTHVEKFTTPTLSISKSGMSVNKAAREAMENGVGFVKLYYDKANRKIGLWFWKNPTPGSYTLFRAKTGGVLHFTAKSFSKEYNINGIIEEAGTRYFPLERDENNKDFFSASLIKSEVESQ